LRHACLGETADRYHESVMDESLDGLSAKLPGVEEVGEEIEADVEALRETAERTGWFHVEHGILIALCGLLAAYLAAYFVFNVDFERLKDWGYLGVFLIAMAGSATIVLPTPSTVAIFGGAVVLDPVLGIPTEICVGIVAGLGDAIGEFSGYALGYAGSDLLRQRRIYRTFERWMHRNGVLTVFVLSTFPNPMFDLVGAAAGGARMPALRFFLSTLAGKIVKDTFLAYGGTFSVGLATDWF
jgi:membrane protein DedA with SNARE-associated domain